MDVTKIGNKIRERRTQLNLTQKELAQLLNISNQLVSKWETGESLPSLEYLDPLCSALQVDFSFFTKDGEQPAPASSTDSTATAEPQPDTQSAVQEKKRKRKINVSLIGAILCFVWVALFIAGFILLTYYVFVPSANKQKYIEEMDDSIENYLSRGYYDITRKLQIDGDDEDDVIYKGIIDENGNISYYNSEERATYADGIVTFDYSADEKYRAELPEHVKTLDDLVKWQISDDEEEENFDLEYITRIRRSDDGFYIEMSEDCLLDDMDGSVKKNIKFLDKIKGDVIIKNGVFVSMSVTVKYCNVTNNENFTIVSGFEFRDEKPVIAHDNLENRKWGSNININAPKADNLVTETDFMEKLGAKKALNRSDELSAAIFNGKLKYGDGYFYSYKDNKITLYNPADLSVKRTYEFTGNVGNVYVYDNVLYYCETENLYYKLYALNLITDEKQPLSNTSYYTNSVKYNAKYCWYSYIDGYRAINLETDYYLPYFETGYNEEIKYVDSAGNVYTESVEGYPKLRVYFGGQGEGVELKGDSYSWDYYLEKPIGDTVYTIDSSKAYRYEKGVYKETVDDYHSDPRLNGKYISALDGYCLNNNVYDKDGKLKDAYTTVNLVTDSQNNYYRFEIKSALGAVGDKVIVNMYKYEFDDYLAVYNKSNFVKPDYYMKLNGDSYVSDLIGVLNLGAKTVIAVKQTDGTYNVWIA